MTEAGWTRERPTVAGVYWFRKSPECVPHIIIACESQHGLEVLWPWDNQQEHFITEYNGEWLGPISPDSYRQGRVEGIKQGIEKLREREKFYTEQEAISEGQMRLARGLQRNESSCCIHELEQLAQAAQDEKGVGDGKSM